MNRVERLASLLPSDVDGAIVSTLTNREYLSSFLASDGFLIVLKDKALFITDSRYIEIARKKVVGAEVILQTNVYEQIHEICRQNEVKRLLCEQELTVAQFNAYKKALPDVELICSDELSAMIGDLRAVKDQSEIDTMCAAQAITDQAFTEICGFIRPGVTEKQIAAELEYYMRKLGADGVAFETICASGPNGSMPHAVPSDRVVQKGEFVTMDYGAKLDGYCSDMTRTVAVGQVTEEMEKVYNTVLEAHLASMAAVRAGVTGRDMDKIARDIIYKAGYEGCFGHSLGHSVGLDIHERPMFSPRSSEIFKAGDIATIEPGIYLEGRFGVRIENMVLVKENGFENLTASKRELITL